MGEPNYSRRKIILLLTLAIFICGVLYYQRSERLRREFKVVFMNVGQGDAALVQFENGEKMLVDCGPNRSVLTALGRNMVFYDRTIDYLLVTHPDLDHYGGCIDVLKNFQVKKIFTNGEDKKGDPFYVEWKTVSLQKNVEFVTTSTVLAVASSTYRFFMPDRDLGLNKSDANNYSIVFLLDHLGKKFLFTGDMGAEAEELLVKKYCPDNSPGCALDADILKVGHHGSDGSSSELFLQKVSPTTAVISVGKNKYGHPGMRAIRHLLRSGADIKRTDLDGDVVFK